jgi:hypothetical protein
MECGFALGEGGGIVGLVGCGGWSWKVPGNVSPTEALRRPERHRSQPVVGFQWGRGGELAGVLCVAGVFCRLRGLSRLRVPDGLVVT